MSLLCLLKWHIEGLWPRSPPLVDAGRPGHRTGWGSFLGVSTDQLLSDDPPTVALSYSPRHPFCSVSAGHESSDLPYGRVLGGQLTTAPKSWKTYGKKK